MDSKFENEILTLEPVAEQEIHRPVLIKLDISNKLQQNYPEIVQTVALLVSTINALKITTSDEAQQQPITTIAKLQRNLAICDDLALINDEMSLLREHYNDYSQLTNVIKTLDGYIKQRLTSQQVADLAYQVIAITEQDDLDRILNHLHGFFHDFRTPLTPIKGYSQLILRYIKKRGLDFLPTDEDLFKEGITSITESWYRLNNYMDYAAEALLGFFEREWMEVTPALKMMSDILKQQLGKATAVKLNADGPFDFDRVFYHQCFWID